MVDATDAVVLANYIAIGSEETHLRLVGSRWRQVGKAFAWRERTEGE